MEASGLQRAPEEPVWRPIDATTEDRRRRFEAVAAFTEKFGPFSSFLKMKVESLDDGMLLVLKSYAFAVLCCVLRIKGVAIVSLPENEQFIGDPIRRALHGGLIAALLDSAAGSAVFTLTPVGMVCTSWV